VNRLLAVAPAGSPAHARLLLVAAGMAAYMGGTGEALRLGEEGLAAWTALGDRRYVALALARIAHARSRLGELDHVQALHAESLALYGDPRLTADLEHPFIVIEAEAARGAGDLAAAGAMHEQSLALGRADGDLHTILRALYCLGLLARDRGDNDSARRLHAESLELARELGDYPCMANALAGLAYVGAETERGDRPARLLAVAARWRELTGTARKRVDEMIATESATAVRAVLGDEAFATAWAEVRAMTLDQAVAYALDESESDSCASRP
jgi:tetratricopeptide (TPR) repeat protein